MGMLPRPSPVAGGAPAGEPHRPLSRPVLAGGGRRVWRRWAHASEEAGEKEAGQAGESVGLEPSWPKEPARLADRRKRPEAQRPSRPVLREEEKKKSGPLGRCWVAD